MQIQDQILSPEEIGYVHLVKDSKKPLLIHHQDGDHHRIFKADGGWWSSTVLNKKIKYVMVRE